MRRKQEQDPQQEKGREQLSSQYREIGIKAVAAAVEPGRSEASERKDVPREERPISTKQRVNNKRSGL